MSDRANAHHGEPLCGEMGSSMRGIARRCGTYNRWIEKGYVSRTLALQLLKEDLAEEQFPLTAEFVMSIYRDCPPVTSRRENLALLAAV